MLTSCRFRVIIRQGFLTWGARGLSRGCDRVTLCEYYINVVIGKWIQQATRPTLLSITKKFRNRLNPQSDWQIAVSNKIPCFDRIICLSQQRIQGVGTLCHGPPFCFDNKAKNSGIFAFDAWQRLWCQFVAIPKSSYLHIIIFMTSYSQADPRGGRRRLEFPLNSSTFLKSMLFVAQKCINSFLHELHERAKI